MKFGEILRKLYFIKWVRIPVKLIISYTTYKLIWDIYEYITMYRNDPGFPRFVIFIIIRLDLICNHRQILQYQYLIHIMQITRNTK